MVLAYVNVHFSGGDRQSPNQRTGSVWVLVTAMKGRGGSDKARELFQRLGREASLSRSEQREGGRSQQARGEGAGAGTGWSSGSPGGRAGTGNALD